MCEQQKNKKKNMLVVGRVAAGLYHRRHFLHMEVQLGPNWRTIYSNPSRKAEEKTQRASSIFTFCSRTLQPPRRGRDLTWGRNKPNKTPLRWNVSAACKFVWGSDLLLRSGKAFATYHPLFTHNTPLFIDQTSPQDECQALRQILQSCL